MAPLTPSFISMALFGSIAVLAQSTTATPPAAFTAVPTAGGGGSHFTGSPHFRLYGSPAEDVVNATLNQLEAAYSCLVDTLGWRSSGLSFNAKTDDGPWYKTNVYDITGSLDGAAGVMGSDADSGLGYLNVLTAFLTDPSVIVHEYGHVLTYHAKTWVDQSRTGAWWETVAQFVADIYMTSPLCASARTKYGQSEGTTFIELEKVIGDSFQVIVDGTADSGNYYQAWPFLTYLTTNPDNYTGLGTNTIRELFAEYNTTSNETPLHTLARVASPLSVQNIVGRYWARMAYLDIDHPQAQKLFFSSRDSLNFANLESTSTGTYKVKSTRKPRYMGANIVPLTGTGTITATINATEPYTATLAVYTTSGDVRYIDFVDGKAQVTVASGEEASLVVANTPDALVQYDGFSLTSELNAGLDYTVQLAGATI